MNAYEKLLSCVNSIRGKTDFVPAIGIVLGSGLGEYAKEIKEVATVAYSDIEGFPVSTVWGIRGNSYLVTRTMCPWLSWQEECIIMKDIQCQTWFFPQG